MRYRILAVCCLLMCGLAQAQVKLPALFSDNMVLQQKSKVKIWGFSSGLKLIRISTSWDKKSYTTLAHNNGDWQTFVNTPTAGGPYTITVTQQNKVTLSNIMIGEVWLCSGQSNMDMPVKGYWDSPILNSNDLLMESPNKNLRLFHVARQYGDKPSTDVKGTWELADVTSVKEFSAVGYQFALFIQQHLDVSVGIIQSTWGGSPIEAWTDKPIVDSILRDSITTDKAITKNVHQIPGNLFNGMIAPLIGYRIAGVIWYQGEQNRYNYNFYTALQAAMVKSWRERWGIGNWPFYYVQLAPMRYPLVQVAMVPRIREAQLKAMEVIPNSGMAVAMDAGDEHNIHAPNKTLIARRLAYWALGKTYQKSGIAFTGPQYKNMEVKGDSIKVQFANMPLGMTTYGKKITQFEIAGDDKKYYPATAFYKKNVVTVYSDKVQHPIAVRYAFKDWITGELYSTEGLPVSPFRTDDW